MVIFKYSFLARIRSDWPNLSRKDIPSWHPGSFVVSRSQKMALQVALGFLSLVFSDMLDMWTTSPPMSLSIRILGPRDVNHIECLTLVFEKFVQVAL